MFTAGEGNVFTFLINGNFLFFGKMPIDSQGLLQTQINLFNGLWRQYNLAIDCSDSVTGNQVNQMVVSQFLVLER